MRLNKLHLEGLLSDQELIRKNKVEHLRQTGRSPYTHKRWERSCNLQAFRDQYGSLSREELSQITKFFSCAGRIRLIRIMNKVIFLNIQDQSGQIQLYVRQDEVGSHPFSEAKNFDLGDIIGGKGRLMKTHKGELTIRLTKIVLLSKALKVLPEKFHGLKKVEQRFRHRYLDLIFNKKTLAVFRRRTLIIRLLQTYLDDLGFLEVETPVLQEIEGGANATPFKTRHKFLKSDLFLRIATEISLKKLVVGMIEKVYEIGKVFRNEGVDATHNPEFTSLELYSAYDNMEDGLDLCENIFAN